ncbi:MAG TPA: substrate-binding domain-containing protein [Chitinophagales bacterium]|nr:substrate-binding domain-containing protein [Chitinophagales bacterium]
MNKAGLAIPVLALLLFLAQGCTQHKPAGTEQQYSRFNGYKGEVDVDADAGLEPIMRQEKEVFDFLYDSVALNLHYKTEPGMFTDFTGHKASALVLARQLSEDEIKHLREQDTIYIRQLVVAYDAVALVGNPRFVDTALSIALLKEYFNPTAKATHAPKMVFAQGSSLVKYMLDTLGYNQKISGNVFAEKSVEEVINYVAQNTDAIGFIPFNFLSDEYDDSAQAAYKRIKVLSLRAKNEKGETIRASANQSDIAAGYYPLTRNITVVSRFTYSDNLEWLFTNFLYQEKGSKIFLKAGLVPAKMTEREVIVNTDGYKAVNR